MLLPSLGRLATLSILLIEGNQTKPVKAEQQATAEHSTHLLITSGVPAVGGWDFRKKWECKDVRRYRVHNITPSFL